ncbi:MAG: cysteine synthase A [Candidatus Eisenbacteria bacterium]
MVHDTILDTIGSTPLIRINRMTGDADAEVVAKLESFNPGSSVKDRIALNMIEDAERSGALVPGDVIVEPTSGNTGIGLALVAAVKGYEAVLVMPETMSVERRAILTHFGASIVLTPGGEGMRGAIAEAERLAAAPGHFMPRQFSNPANPDAHRKTTAREIIRALEGRALDFFVAGVGTGGTVTGTGQVLKETYPDITVVAVEPAGSPVLSGGPRGSHGIQGIGAGFVPDNYDRETVDEVLQVGDGDAMETARALACQEGILAGISSGAAMFAALEVARRAGRGKLVLVMLPDTGERYLSTDLFR